MPPIWKLIVSGILVVFAALGFLINPAPLWLRLLRIPALHVGLLLSYSANIWLTTGKEHRLGRSRVARLTVILSVIVVISGYLSRDNLGVIFRNELFRPTLLYYMHYGLGALVVLFLDLLIVGAFWQSIRQAKELTYRVRRMIGLVSMLAAVVYALVIVLELLLSVFGSSAYRVQLDLVFYLALPLTTLMPLVNIVPQSLLIRLVRPFENYTVRRQQREQQLIEYLHSRLIQIVPHVHLHNEQLRHLRLDIEISDARGIIWSQTSHQWPLSPEEEAEHLNELLRDKRVLSEPGEYVPPTTKQRDVQKHNLAVAKHLKHLVSAHPISSEAYV
jgi:hypothetical protein